MKTSGQTLFREADKIKFSWKMEKITQNETHQQFSFCLGRKVLAIFKGQSKILFTSLSARQDQTCQPKFKFVIIA